MSTISLCMIVKNEEAILARCLDSIADLMDEIIIVDTGSTDRTKEIAANYTDLIFDYPWHDDFAAARNFSFEKASMEYIYAPDADELLDDINRKRFLDLKNSLTPDIEIVQMLYHTVSEFNTVLNTKKEYRPKLFKRLRTFQWIDPIHETIQTAPVVYDSDIEILHMPQNYHHKRDFSVFLKTYQREGMLSKKIFRMYAKELLKLGEKKDFDDAFPLFLTTYQTTQEDDLRKDAACILARIYRTNNENDNFFKLALKDMLTTPCSEICYELGCYFQEKEDFDEAILWFYNAAFETSSILDIHTSGDLPLYALANCNQAIAHYLSETEPDSTMMIDYFNEQAMTYRQQAEEWKLPEE